MITKNINKFTGYITIGNTAVLVLGKNYKKYESGCGMSIDMCICPKDIDVNTMIAVKGMFRDYKNAQILYY